MKLIVGLGNPGVKYEKTRHNMGFMVVEQFLKDFESVGKTVWTFEERFKSYITSFEWQRRSSQDSSGQARLEKVILVKPKTYMNNSGLAVKLLTTYYKLPTTSVLVVHDDIDLPLGKIKIRLGGGTAGQKGVESIIETLGTDQFWRFRIGIGISHNQPKDDNRRHQISKNKIKNVEDFVLGSFKGAEWGKARKLIKKGAEALSVSLEHGLEVAQNQFN